MAALPMEEPPCVWVLAGVLSQRPCHRGYDCEDCELFLALRGAQGPEASDLRPAPAADREVSGRTSGENAATAYLRHLATGCNLHLDRAYSPTQFWIQEAREGEVLLGLDGQTLRILFPLEDVVLPRPGVWLTRGETMGWILRGHMALPLRAPLSGEALETNGPLLDQLRKRGVPDAEPGWLIRLRPHEAWDRVPDLLQGEAMLSWTQAKLGILRRSLLEAMAPGAEAGPTLNDGGEWNPNLEEVLGPSAFRRLVDQLFREGA